MNKKVLVTGVLGQDGANMCEYLLEMGNHKVFGMIRRVSNPNFTNCKKFLNHPDFQKIFQSFDEFKTVYFFFPLVS